MRGTIVLCVLLTLGLSGSAATGNKPALIPLPQELTWQDKVLQLPAHTEIAVKNEELLATADILKGYLEKQGLSAAITAGEHRGADITLELASLTSRASSEEAYWLEVSEGGIHIKANHDSGAFYAIQTLKQLIENNVAPTCEILDWPAFPWRGYLVDVGRNFQSMELLKEQIDVMASYKLNVFHFHFTEDIAWRLESRRYPQLTAADNMIRNPGKYYTQDDMHELFAYCAERNIMLLPEIDMPGHSAAFTRAMGVDMQSEQGMVYVKNILEEFCDTYDFEYIHIGGDEVEITNEHFLPEMVAYLESRGKRTLGWDPGGNLPQNTIRQLWMGGEEQIMDTTSSQYIDSKHLYVNHMDPIETVPTLFYRKIGGQTAAHQTLLGGILCSWPDRAVSDEQDVLWQNAIYPGLLTFSERSWRGGGESGWRANVGKTSDEHLIAAFTEYENRLIDHKHLYFTDKPFPYIRQSAATWRFYGPYSNSGKLSSSFLPEEPTFVPNTHEPSFEAIGATLILRHWWSEVVEGLLENPMENTTWYASTTLWSEEAGLKPFWIGFDNFSRSYASDTPQQGTWDDRSSKLWVNGTVVAPPNWLHAGRKGNLEHPMVDEGYSFREPTMIYLNKGWNEVLVKVPVGTFRGKDWQNPVKWMFTFTPLEVD